MAPSIKLRIENIFLPEDFDDIYNYSHCDSLFVNADYCFVEYLEGKENIVSVFNDDGSLNFHSLPNRHGNVSLKIIGIDTINQTTTADTVSIQIESINDAPITMLGNNMLIMEDFENWSNRFFNGYWAGFIDSENNDGASSFEPDIISDRSFNSAIVSEGCFWDNCLHLKYSINPGELEYGFAGIQHEVESSGMIADYSTLQSIRFMAKGYGEISLKFRSRYINLTGDWGYHNTIINLQPEWTFYDIPVTSLFPSLFSESYYDAVSWDMVKDAILTVQIVSGSRIAEVDSIDLWIDQIHLNITDPLDLDYNVARLPVNNSEQYVVSYDLNKVFFDQEEGQDLYLSVLDLTPEDDNVAISIENGILRAECNAFSCEDTEFEMLVKAADNGGLSVEQKFMIDFQSHPVSLNNKIGQKTHWVGGTLFFSDKKLHTISVYNLKGQKVIEGQYRNSYELPTAQEALYIVKHDNKYVLRKAYPKQ